MALSNFKTVIVGTAEEIAESNKIFLYNKYALEKLGYSARISPYKIEEVYGKVSSTLSSCMIIEKEANETCYEYKWTEASKTLPDGFDTIIYVSSTDNRPIAYTEFSCIQGKDVSLEICVTPEKSESVVSGLKVINNLNPVQNIQTFKDTAMVGDGNYKHPDTGKYLEDSENYKKGLIYVDDVSGIGNGPCIKQTGAVVKEGKLYKLGFSTISSDVDLKDRYIYYSFGWYEGHPAVYAWNDKKDFGIVSLSEINLFGNNVVYSKSNEYSKNTIPDPDKSLKILYGAGKYFIVETASGEMRVFDTKSMSFVPLGITGTKCFIDPYDINSEIKSLPELSTYDSLIEVVPELNGTFLDIYGAYSSLELIRKVGNWFILRKRVVGGYLYAFSGLSSAIWMTDKEYENSIIVNDATVIIDEGKYYLLCGTYGKSEKTCGYKIKNGGKGKEVSTIKVNGCEIETILGETETPEDTEEELKYKVAPKTSNLCDTFLNDFRRGPYPVGLKGLPKLIGACSGVLFFEETEDLLKYL